jgi:hypothetical protein
MRSSHIGPAQSRGCSWAISYRAVGYRRPSSCQGGDSTQDSARSACPCGTPIWHLPKGETPWPNSTSSRFWRLPCAYRGRARRQCGAILLIRGTGVPLNRSSRRPGSSSQSPDWYTEPACGSTLRSCRRVFVFSDLTAWIASQVGVRPVQDATVCR